MLHLNIYVDKDCVLASFDKHDKLRFVTEINNEDELNMLRIVYNIKGTLNYIIASVQCNDNWNRMCIENNLKEMYRSALVIGSV